MTQSCGFFKWNFSVCEIQQDNDSLGIPDYDTSFLSEPQMEFVVELYVISLLCFVGIMGNIASIVVLQRDQERRESIFLLQALAVSDTLYLLASVLRYPLKYIVYDRSDYTIMQPYVFPLLKTCQSVCIWMMVLVTIDRFIYVCHPLQARILFDHKKRKISAFLIFCVGFLYNLPRFFDQCIVTVQYVCLNRTITRMVYTPLFNSAWYFHVYQYGLYIVCLYVGPLAVLCYMNCRLISAIRASRRRHREVYNGVTLQYHENNATLVLVIIIIVFLMCETPELILKILTVIHRHLENISLFSTNPNLYLHLSTICSLLMVLNCSVNFFIYVFFGKRFRMVMKYVLYDKPKDTTNELQLETYPLHNQNHIDAQTNGQC